MTKKFQISSHLCKRRIEISETHFFIPLIPSANFSGCGEILPIEVQKVEHFRILQLSVWRDGEKQDQDKSQQKETAQQEEKAENYPEIYGIVWDIFNFLRVKKEKLKMEKK